MPEPDLRTFLRPLASWLAGSVASLLAALASAASIAGSRLGFVQRRSACGAKPEPREPRSEVPAAAPAPASTLLRALRDPSVEVALTTIEALSRQPGPKTASALREVLENADGYFHPAVRAAAVTALVRMLPPAELDRVIDSVGDVDAEVSLAALHALAERAPSLVAPHALRVLRDRSDYYLPPVRRAAAEALLHGREVSPALLRDLWESEPDPAIRDLLERAGF
jgi:hypothetical protein